MRLAYADPPYIGQARKHYAHDPQCAEVNHAELIDRLVTFDGWALSCISPTLRELLPLCPEDTRVLAWVKPWASWKPGRSPAFAWEPVLCKPARKMPDALKVRDWCAASVSRGVSVHGAKPDAFCYWLFAALGASSVDSFADLYPGSGAVGRCWQKWSRQPELFSRGGHP